MIVLLRDWCLRHTQAWRLTSSETTSLSPVLSQTGCLMFALTMHSRVVVESLWSRISTSWRFQISPAIMPQRSSSGETISMQSLVFTRRWMRLIWLITWTTRRLCSASWRRFVLTSTSTWCASSTAFLTSQRMRILTVSALMNILVIRFSALSSRIWSQLTTCCLSLRAR